MSKFFVTYTKPEFNFVTEAHVTVEATAFEVIDDLLKFYGPYGVLVSAFAEGAWNRVETLNE